MKEDNNTEYWASQPVKDIAAHIMDKVDDYYTYLSVSGRLDIYTRSWSYYYRARLTGAKLNPAGEQGELTTLSVNQYRNLLLHLETMTAQQRIAFEARASNSDVKSQSQVILANGLLDYYTRQKRLDRYFKQALKTGLLWGEGFVRIEWDATGGKEYGKSDTGATLYEGDIKFSNYNPLTAIRDFTLNDPKKENWIILRDFVNKFDLAGKYPAYAKEIIEQSNDLTDEATATGINKLLQVGEDTDNITIYTLLHKPTPGLPQGRYTVALPNGTVIVDGPIPYDETHVYRLSADEEQGTIFGYTVGFDLLPVQEMLDIVYSTSATNISTFGVQNIQVPKGHDISTSQLSGGLNLIEYDRELGPIEPLNLTRTPPEVYEFGRQLEQIGETISGVNSVTRGNPEASLKSGSALALVQSMAIQFSMNLQQSYVEIIEDSGTGVINILKKYAAVPRVAEITGKSNRPLMKEFTGQDLDLINRVMVDMGNPLTRTIAGKVNLADMLLEKGLIQNPDQYIQVLNTGRMEPVFEGVQSSNLLIKYENEGLSEGVPQVVLATDQHAQHILEHKTILDNPEVRKNPNDPVVVATLEHIQEHFNMLETINPALLALLRQQSIAPMGMPTPMPTKQEMSGENPGEMMNPEQAVMQKAGEVNLPNMPSPPENADPQTAEIIENM